MAEDELLARAMRAVGKATGRRGSGVNPDPVVLYRSRRICLLLPEIATVARIALADAASLAASARELAVARYLSERGAPVVAPSGAMPSAPYVEEGMTVTLWPHIDHVQADYADHREIARAAHALRRVQDALADYPGELPSYARRIEECAALLRRPEALPDVASHDRIFLMRTYERLSKAVVAFDIRAAPLHGDAHMGNVFMTPGGPLWTDFETACLGPREWDASGVPHPAAFQPLDPALYAIMLEMRSLCVVIWCSTLGADPRKRAAAEFQLARLKKLGDPAAPR
jgi:hypothetical protein